MFRLVLLILEEELNGMATQLGRILDSQFSFDVFAVRVNRVRA